MATNLLVLGAGKIGLAAAGMLAETGDYQVTLGDNRALDRRGDLPPEVAPVQLDVVDDQALRRAMAGKQVVLSTLPFHLDARVAEMAKREGLHYFDPTEDVATARKIRALAETGGGTVFVPQCGLAPGFVAIVANHLVGGFDEPHDVKPRVGALPQFPDNALKYNLTWSTEGLINEYCNPCDVIYEGKRREVPPLEGLEHFSMDGVRYEAFSTSGGIGSLCDTLEGRVRNLNYKTIRYPGHRDMIKMLAMDLNLRARRDVFKDVIEHGIPTTTQDVVVIFVTVTGRRDGILTQETYARKIYGHDGQSGLSAIQRTTASAICAMIDLHGQGSLPESGFARQEEVDFQTFTANRFGKLFA